MAVSQMMAMKPLLRVNLGLPAGLWRWAALGFVGLALAAAVLAIISADQARWAGVALLGGIAALGSLALYVVWPREALSAQDARRIAEAAARANVAWAITSSDGAVIECNDVYRRMTGVADVVFSGGVFMNALLSREAGERLAGEGFRIYRHRLVPPNDGGLSLGQVAVAAARLASGDA